MSPKRNFDVPSTNRSSFLERVASELRSRQDPDTDEYEAVRILPVKPREVVAQDVGNNVAEIISSDAGGVLETDFELSGISTIRIGQVAVNRSVDPTESDQSVPVV